jgi:hypothetical protein
MQIKSSYKQLQPEATKLHHHRDGQGGVGALGDALHALLCGAGHNMRMLLRKLRLLCAQYPLRINQFMVVQFEK